MPKLNSLSLSALALLMLLAAVTRGLALTDGLWIDELHTSWTVADGLGDIGPRARLGNQQPLYFYLPWIAIGLFGEREWTLRLPSYVAGIALIPAVFWLAWKWTGSMPAAFTAAAMAALDRQWLFYAQEARVYVIVQLAAVVQFALLARLLEKPTPKVRTAHVALAALMFYLHYTTALLIAAEAAAWLVVWRMRRGGDHAEPPRYGWRPAALDAACYLLLIAPALPHVWIVAERRENWTQFVQQPAWIDVLLVFPLDIYVVAALLIGGCAAVGERIFRRSRPERSPRELLRRAALLSACWLAVPLLLAYLATRTEAARLFFPRYLIGASAAALLIVACCVAFQRTAAARWVVVLSLLYLAAWRGHWLATSLDAGDLWVHSSEQWRQAIAAIAERDPRGERAVLIDAGLIESRAWHDRAEGLLRDYCTLPVRGMYRLPGPERTIVPLFEGQAVASQRELAAIGSPAGCFILRRGGNHRDRPLVVESAGRELRLRVKQRHKFGSVTLLDATASE